MYESKRIVSQTDRYLNTAFVHSSLFVLNIYLFVNYTFWLTLINNPPCFIAGGVTGWVLTDVLSYLVHLIIDSKVYNNLITQGGIIPIKTIIDLHHEEPLNYSRLTHVELISITFPIMIPLHILFLISEQYTVTAYALGIRTTTLLFGYMSGYIHKWSHERICGMHIPFYAKILQNLRIILHPLAHRKHHQTFDCQYSLVNGIIQPLFDLIKQKLLW